MANIMLNKACNLQCPYCFANEFVNNPFAKSNINRASNISMEDFKKAVKFILDSGERFIGIIGGEPTMHPEFKEMMNYLINDERVDAITLFTNGITLKDHLDLFKKSEKMGTLVNTNSPNDMTENQWKMLTESLDAMYNAGVSNRMTLGINMYKEGFDYQFIIDLLKKYKMSHVRTAIVVPNDEEGRHKDALDYFRTMKPHIFEFYKKLEQLDIMPTYDCNQMPVCVTTPEEKKWLANFWKYEKTVEKHCNLTDGSECGVVLDILPDLTAVRCFGMSEDIKVSIEEFDTLQQIVGYFSSTIDMYMYAIPTSEECEDCFYRKTKQCAGGCLAFKSGKINKERISLEEKYNVALVL